jgi:protein-disulfide isomerase
VEVGNAPTLGPSDAPVTVVEFADFECFFCSRADAIGGAVREKYPGRLRWVFKQDPLAFHAHAEAAAEAALAAGDQGKYLAMHDQLFLGTTALEAADLARYAQAAGLDPAKFKAALASGKLKDRVQRDVSQAEALGVTGVPTFFINGHRLVGAVSFDTWTHLLDAELPRVDAADAGR